MIIETSDNRFFFVADYEDPNLAHVWRGLRGKFVKGGHFVIKSGTKEEMVRKAATRIVEPDILKTLTTDEIMIARDRYLAEESAQHNEDCFQLWRYSRGALFRREDAERALRQIRGEK
jgi:hypothetical protein